MIDSVSSDKIAEKHYKDIYLHCLFLIEDEYEAEEITQNVFLLFEQKRNMLVDENIRAWLYKVSDILIKEYFRKSQKNKKHPLQEGSTVIADILDCIDYVYPITPEEIEEKKQIIFDSLSEKEYKIFKMHNIENKTYRQIAEELNMSAKAVNVFACRTRKKITEIAKTLTSAWILLFIKIFFENF